MYPVPPIVLPPPAGLFDDVRAGISRPCAATRVPSATIDSCIDARRQAARHVARAGTRASPHWAHDASAAQRAYKSPLAADADTAGFLEEAFYLSESPVLQVSQPRTTMTTTLTTLASLAATMPAAYTTRKDWPGPRANGDGVWVIYATHDEAAAALSLSHPSFATLEPALESDLEPYDKLERVAFGRDTHTRRASPPASPLAFCATPSSSTSAASSAGPRTPAMSPALLSALPPLPAPRGRFTLSSNPPNPKISYRAGDWVCPAPSCGAYNFARNMACIGCGNPHPYTHAPPQQQQQLATTNTMNNAPHTLPPLQQHPQHPQHLPPHQQQQHAQQQPPMPHQHFMSPRFAQQASEERAARRPLPPLPPLVTHGARYAASLPNSRNPSPSRAGRDFSPARALSPRRTFSPTRAFAAPGHTMPSGAMHSGTMPSGNMPSGTMHALSGAGHMSAPQSPTGVLGPLTLNAKPHTPTYPLLTPSGHALSAGGRVRNISTDPTAPCIMYWPDNEPLPERGQIRPSGSAVIQYPPIVNTGNKGAAEKQPGDWVCSKCHYLNWRRRKVCQTCYPYAEGNGDSISQAVQAERIALLTNLLNQTEHAFPHPLQRRASVPVNAMAPPAAAPFAPQPAPRHAAHASLGHLSYAPADPRFPAAPTPHAARSRSQADLRAQYHARADSQGALAGVPLAQRPIYQTPAYHASRNSSPARSAAAYGSRVPSPTAAFLPACLQDVVAASPAHSSPTTSASSADLSFDDYAEFAGYGSGCDAVREDDGAAEPELAFRAPGGATRRSGGRKAGDIWRMDGEESRTLRPYAPIHADCIADIAGRLASGLSLATA